MKRIMRIACITALIIALSHGYAAAMSADEFYMLASGYDSINPFAATVQSAHETGDWTSYLWMNANNGAGLKAPQKWVQSGKPYVTVQSSERSGSTYQNSASYFRKYETPEQFMSDYAMKIEGDYPHSARNRDNIWGYFAGLYRGRIGKWATDHRYYEKLTIKAIKLAPYIYKDTWMAELLDNYQIAVSRGDLEEWQKNTIEKQLTAAGVNVGSSITGSNADSNRSNTVDKILDDIYKRLKEESGR